MSSVPPAKFFVNRGIVSSRTDLSNLLRPLLKQTVTYRFLRGQELVAHGTGWVERIVMDQPEVSTYFTPLAICLNIDSFEHLEFETRPDQLIVYSLVQGDERVVIEFAPIDRRGPVAVCAAPARVRHERLRPDGAARPGARRVVGRSPGDPPAAARRRSSTIPGMFECTALPDGPRVISARVPGSRSVSVAAYVLAGSRHEAAGQAGVAHFMEHITFKGTAAYPTTRAISEAIEGVGGLVQRGDRARVDRLLGPRAGPRGAPAAWTSWAS